MSKMMVYFDDLTSSFLYIRCLIMRTTLTLDPDVAERLRQQTVTGQRTLKQVVNESLRIGLGLKRKPSERPYKVITHNSPFRPGIDPAKLNQLADELEVEAVISKLQT